MTLTTPISGTVICPKANTWGYKNTKFDEPFQGYFRACTIWPIVCCVGRYASTLLLLLLLLVTWQIWNLAQLI